jgi:ABC-type transport system substrate-binding protein
MPPNNGPNGFLFPILHSGGAWNLLGHVDSELDLLIEKQQMELFDSQARAESIFKIQRHIVDQAYMLGLGDNVDRWVTNDAVRGFSPNPAISEYSFWSKVWMDE